MKDCLFGPPKRPLLAAAPPLLLLLLLLPTTDATGDHQNHTLVIVILSQAGPVHSRRAVQAREDILRQAAAVAAGDDLQSNAVAAVLCLHDQWSALLGAWTTLPIIPDIYQKYSNTHWTLFIGENTNLNLRRAYHTLAAYDPTKELFFGRELRDTRPAIIHHFAFANNPGSFAYPDFESGFVFSNALLKRLTERQARLMTDFSIDAQHELAMFIWDDGKGVRLTHLPVFCALPAASERGTDPSDSCITWYNSRIPDCSDELTKDDVFVMVKTCEKFHGQRLPIIKELWSDSVKHIEYCSEKDDPTIPTVALGIQNTERGHCSKLQAILQRAAVQPHIHSKKWLVIADDDTLLNFERLVKLLKCYPSTAAVAIGERYGYDVRRGVLSNGYDYITGGGSMVLSMVAVRKLVERGLRCPSDDSPDDMMLGIWLGNAGIPITHSRLFHQARPEEYSPDLLRHQDSVSFHKFDNVAEARAIYKRWLTDRSASSMLAGNRRTDRGGEL